jgi:hypothetical protein
MRTTHRSRRSIPARSTFAGFRFPPDVIVLAVRWYLRFGLSYRDVASELFIKHAQPAMCYRHGVLTIYCAQVQFFGFLLVPLPILFTPWRREQFGLFFFQRALLTFFGGIFLAAVCQFFFR